MIQNEKVEMPKSASSNFLHAIGMGEANIQVQESSNFAVSVGHCFGWVTGFEGVV